MSETNTILNSRPRKTLASQLDRLDSVLDGLSENLNQAVADAVQGAVHKALVELMTNPELVALLGGAAGRAAPAPAAPEAIPVQADERPTLGQRLGQAKDWAGAKVRVACAACGRSVRAGLGLLGGLKPRLLALWRLRKPLPVALAVGTAAGVAAFAAGPCVAGLLTGLAGSAAALAVQARLWLQHALGGIAVATDS